MYSSSLGSIQAALKKLMAGGLITFREEAEGKRKKKIYSITPAGRQAFSLWVSSPMETGSAKNPELGKLYFMGFSDRETRKENIQAVIDSLQKPRAVLDTIIREGESMKVPPEAEEILHYQMASARFGRDFMQFQIEWYENFLKEEAGRL